jgi:hypothetical protein
MTQARATCEDSAGADAMSSCLVEPPPPDVGTRVDSNAGGNADSDGNAYAAMLCAADDAGLACLGMYDVLEGSRSTAMDVAWRAVDERCDAPHLEPSEHVFVGSDGTLQRVMVSRPPPPGRRQVLPSDERLTRALGDPRDTTRARREVESLFASGDAPIRTDTTMLARAQYAVLAGDDVAMNRAHAQGFAELDSGRGDAYDGLNCNLEAHTSHLAETLPRTNRSVAQPRNERADAGPVGGRTGPGVSDLPARAPLVDVARVDALRGARGAVPRAPVASAVRPRSTPVAVELAHDARAVAAPTDELQRGAWLPREATLKRAPRPAMPLPTARGPHTFVRPAPRAALPRAPLRLDDRDLRAEGRPTDALGAHLVASERRAIAPAVRVGEEAPLTWRDGLPDLVTGLANAVRARVRLGAGDSRPGRASGAPSRQGAGDAAAPRGAREPARVSTGVVDTGRLDGRLELGYRPVTGADDVVRDAAHTIRAHGGLAQSQAPLFPAVRDLGARVKQEHGERRGRGPRDAASAPVFPGAQQSALAAPSDALDRALNDGGTAHRPAP